MTIYGLINSQTDLPSWTILSGASILQGGNPFFVPDFADRFEMCPSVALRIGKLGKGFAPRFAERYVDSIAPCTVFLATDLLGKLREKGLPWTPAICYDRSLALGRFQPMKFEEIATAKVDLTISDESKARSLEWHTSEAGSTPAEVLSFIARDNTLKTGDMIILPIAQQGIPVEPGMRVSLGINGNDSVQFNIR